MALAKKGGVTSTRGFTLVEVLMALALIGIVSAIAVPVFIESSARNSLWNASERIGANIRETRLKAITQNTTYRIVFNCPTVGSLRGLIMTGDPVVDDAADRCNQTLEGDSAAVEMPPSVTYDPDGATALQVSGRGVFTAIGGAVPLVVSVNYGATVRTLTVSTTGQITFSDVH